VTEGISVKLLLRWRWVLVAILVVILYFLDGRHLPDIDHEYFFLLVALFLFASVNKQLERIERRVDAISKGETASPQQI